MTLQAFFIPFRSLGLGVDGRVSPLLDDAELAEPVFGALRPFADAEFRLTESESVTAFAVKVHPCGYFGVLERMIVE